MDHGESGPNFPARPRGRIDPIVNGSYWLGAASTLVLLNPGLLPVDLGWRLGFGIGAVLGLGIMVLRRWVPESPRWLLTHGHDGAAEAAVAEIEDRVSAAAGALPRPSDEILSIRRGHRFGFGLVPRTILGRHRARAVLALVLMLAQAFLYNALCFTYGLVLTRFYAVAPRDTRLYLLPLAAGNLMGPLLLGHFFDTVGRRAMIALTYTVSGLPLVATGWLFDQGLLTATTQTVAGTAIFFFASAAASAAYLTASEIFPLETRGLAIAIFFAAGTAAGGVVAPWLFGRLIGIGGRLYIFEGYAAAALLMVVAAATEWRVGVDAENRSLESIAAPLAADSGINSALGSKLMIR